MAWEDSKKAIREGKAEYRWTDTCIPGLRCINAMLPDVPIPLGFIWYSWANGGQLQIDYIFVHEDVRRAGLATKMLDYLLEVMQEFTFVVSTGKFNEMSRPWGIKYGFKQDKRRDYWFKELTPKKPKAKKSA